MIKEIIIKPQKKYGNYFLSMEAPGDEEPEATDTTGAEDTEIEQPDEEVYTPKSNTKVIDVKPNNRKKLDFTDGADIPDEEPEDDMSEETPMDDDIDTGVDTGEDMDFTAGADGMDDGAETQGDVTADAQPATEPTVTDPNQPVDDGVGNEDNAEIDTGEDMDFTADADGTEGEGDAGIDTGDDTDFTAGADGTDVTADTEAQPADTGTTEQKGPGLEYNSTRKYILFENFISLANAINNYISKFENSVNDNVENNKIIKNAINKLREIEDLCNSYMTMKFEASGYVQSLLFFQNLVVMVQLVFDYVGKSRKLLQN